MKKNVKELQNIYSKNILRYIRCKLNGQELKEKVRQDLCRRLSNEKIEIETSSMTPSEQVFFLKEKKVFRIF